MSSEHIFLTVDDKQNMKEYWKVFQAHSREILTELKSQMETIPTLTSLMSYATEEQPTRYAIQTQAIMQDKWEEFYIYQRDSGISYAKNAVPFNAWFQFLSMFRIIFLKYLNINSSVEFKNSELIVKGLLKFVDITIGIVGDAYIGTKETIIKGQQEAIKELSTPILQLRDKFLILPVIGMMDTYRAKQLTQNLLQTIRTTQAKIIVMDITGVPLVDSKVANYLVQTAQAVKLMGGKIILTGISPEVAQTMVTIGADLQEITTLGSLEDGIRIGEQFLGYKTRPTDERL